MLGFRNVGVIFAVLTALGLFAAQAGAQVVDGPPPPPPGLPAAGAAPAPGAAPQALPGLAPGAQPGQGRVPGLNPRGQRQQGGPGGPGGPQFMPGAPMPGGPMGGPQDPRMLYMQTMMQRGTPPAIAVAEGFVFVVYGGTLYQFTVDGLQEIAKVNLIGDRPKLDPERLKAMQERIRKGRNADKPAGDPAILDKVENAGQ
ncbi:MAG: hypothetical protein QM473_02735 [Acidobacteriota bacterium]|nr:hypothetical protein [Acidobacteriota bacterium]